MSQINRIKWLYLVIPGGKHLAKGNVSLGLLWLLGTACGYAFGPAPGLAIHGWYLGQHVLPPVGKKKPE
ncbi:MAG: hypothetical protein HC890_13365 [Chloroflexaceae bacterium]|nr:hypothetical protein [Chloroflexaceae bacterium]